MADLAITAANVVKVGSGTVMNGQPAGEALTAGNSIYLDGNGNWFLAKANGNAAQAGSNGLGIALSSAPGVTQPVSVFLGGTINLGATLSVGQIYGLSNNAGRIAPFSDMGTNSYISILCVASSTANAKAPPSNCWATGIQHS